MTIGTKSLLWGTHQFILHPAGVLVAFLKVHKRLPSLAELFAIIVHDWGYWGCAGIDRDGGEEHPYLGARIMERLFGTAGRNLVLGHSSYTCKKEGIDRSSLYLPDKYYFILLPARLHWALAILAGEDKEYAENKDVGFNPWLFRERLKEKIRAERTCESI